MSLQDLPDFVRVMASLIDHRGGQQGISTHTDTTSYNWKVGASWTQVHQFTISTPTIPTGVTAVSYAIQILIYARSEGDTGDIRVLVDGTVIGTYNNIPAGGNWYEFATDVLQGSHTVTIEFMQSPPNDDVWISNIEAFCGIGTTNGSYTLCSYIQYSVDGKALLTVSVRSRVNAATVHGQIRADDSTVDSASGNVTNAIGSVWYSVNVTLSSTYRVGAYFYCYTNTSTTPVFITYHELKGKISLTLG